jgi:hypothetical protein
VPWRWSLGWTHLWAALDGNVIVQPVVWIGSSCGITSFSSMTEAVNKVEWDIGRFTLSFRHLQGSRGNSYQTSADKLQVLLILCNWFHDIAVFCIFTTFHYICWAGFVPFRIRSWIRHARNWGVSLG